MFRECLVGRPYPRDTRETQLSPSVLNLCIPVMCRAHASFRMMLSREIPAKTLLSSIVWVFTHSLSITQSLQFNHTIKYRVQQIKWNYNQIWHGIKLTKHIVVNYNFTRVKKIREKQKDKWDFMLRQVMLRVFFYTNQPIFVLMYKKTCFNTNELDKSLPSVVVSML